MQGFSTYDIAMAKMKLNGLRLNVASMWLNGVQVWPIYKYVITSASVVYSSGDKITAKGDNYATVIGTVEKRKGEIVEETLTDIELVPVFTSADFYLVDNQIHAYDLEKTIKPLTTMSFTVKYVDEHEKESEEFGPMYVTQQENERLVHDLTACDIAVQAAGITCLQNTFSILPTLQADWHDEYTSTYQEDYRYDEAEMTIYINGVAQAAKAKHNVVYYYQVDRDNKHHTDARSWSCYGAYDVRTTQTITLNQGADSKYYVWESQGHLISIDKTDSGISAADGDDLYNVSAYAQRTGYRYWQSDDTPTGDTPTVDQTPESWSYGQSSGTGRTFERFSASVTQQGQLKIHHDSMGTFETVDTARYDVWNTSDENVRAYTDDYSIYNRKELDVPAHDSQYGFDIDYVGQSWIDKYGGSVYVACYEKYYHYTDHYTYSSGSEAGGARSDLSRSVNPSVITCNRTEATVYVGEKRIVIPANTHNLSEKYFVVSSSYGGYSDSVTFTQLPDTVVPDGAPTTTHGINVTEEDDNLAPGGTTRKIWKVNAFRVVEQRYVWATDGAYYDKDSTTYAESWNYRSQIEGVRYSPSKSQDGQYFIITHSDMEWHVTTDICQYKVFNESDETKFVEGLRCEVENEETERYITSRELSVSQSPCACTDSYIYISPTLKNNYEVIYASGYHGTDWDRVGSIAIYIENTYINSVSSGASASKYIGDNKHSTSMRSFANVYAKIGDTTSSVITIYQQADSIRAAGAASITHYLDVLDDENTISAEGGLRSWEIHAYRIEETEYVWNSDGAHYSWDRPSYDENWDYRAIVEGVRMSSSRSGSLLIVTHTNMGRNVTTDSATYKVWNTSDQTVYRDNLTASATNRAQVTPERTTGFTASDIRNITSDGASVLITGVRYYISEKTVYSSGIVDGGDALQIGTNAKGANIVSGSGATITGNPSDGYYLNLTTQPQGASQRTVTFYASYDEYGSQAVATQYEGDWTEEVYRCTSFSVASSSVPAASYGQSAKVAVTFVAQKQVTRYHDGVATVLSWEASDRPHRITCSNSNFTLYNATRGSISDDITAYSGDSIYVYPTSANTSSTSRSTTLTEMVDRNTETFSQDAVSKPVCRISRSVTEGDVSFSLDFSATYNVASQLTIGYTLGYLDFRGRQQSITSSITMPQGENSVSLSYIGTYISSSITSVSPDEDTTYYYRK